MATSKWRRGVGDMQSSKFKVREEAERRAEADDQQCIRRDQGNSKAYCPHIITVLICHRAWIAWWSRRETGGEHACKRPDVRARPINRWWKGWRGMRDNGGAFDRGDSPLSHRLRSSLVSASCPLWVKGSIDDRWREEKAEKLIVTSPS